MFNKIKNQFKISFLINLLPKICILEVENNLEQKF